MRHSKIRLCVIAALLAALGTGCGSITTGMVVQKAGMWLAKEAVKKGVKELRERDDQEDDGEGSGRSARRTKASPPDARR